MSSSKRRKLESQDAPKPAVSAVSALAARRRLAAVGEDTASSTSPSSGHTESRSNSFSALQALRGREHGVEGSPLRKRPDDRQQTTPTPREKVVREETTNTSAGSSLAPALVQYSSFRPSRHNHRVKAGNVAELSLSESERFMVLGSFGIRVTAGEVTVAGATLRPSDQISWIHAPHCHAVPVLRTSENTVLELHNDPSSRGLRQLGLLSPLFRRIWNEPVRGKKSTYKFLHTSDDAPKRCMIQDLVSPPEWNKKLSSLVETVATKDTWAALICGPKSAGKSTFSRLLANKLLTSTASSQSAGVALLDLDPGQPEFSPAGTLALIDMTQPNLGPPFTHPGLNDLGGSYKVVRCHPLASVSPASAPGLYLECAYDLIETYRKELQGRKLLINTPGWILGTGLDLITSIIEHANPEEVIYMSEDGPIDTVDTLRGAAKKTFRTLPSQQSEFTSRTAAHLRAMQAMSYFHLEGEAGVRSGSQVRWNPSPLTASRPWRVGYSGRGSGILGIISYDYQAPPELLAESINGMILAAVEIERPEAFRDLLGSAPSAEDARHHINDSTRDSINARLGVRRTPEDLPYIPNPNDVALDPRFSRCIGLVLIRGIDKTNKSLQIITPTPSQRIAEAREQGRDLVLIHGKFDAPTWAYAEELYERSDQDETTDKGLELMDEDTSEDDSDEQPEQVQSSHDVTTAPWVEVLAGNEKRPVGSRVWRVRRDLGRSHGD